MTWGEFKKAVEEKGARDSDKIWYIDITFPREIELQRYNDELGVQEQLARRARGTVGEGLFDPL